jgi:hypothetical protein
MSCSSLQAGGRQDRAARLRAACCCSRSVCGVGGVSEPRQATVLQPMVFNHSDEALRGLIRQRTEPRTKVCPPSLSLLLCRCSMQAAPVLRQHVWPQPQQRQRQQARQPHTGSKPWMLSVGAVCCCLQLCSISSNRDPLVMMWQLLSAGLAAVPSPCRPHVQLQLGWLQHRLSCRCCAAVLCCFP